MGQAGVRHAGVVVYLVIALVVAALLVVGFVVVVRKGAASARGRIEARLGELEVERSSRANFYGVESRGARQVRALGTIALTPEAVVFLQLVPSGELVIPRAAITGTSTARGFLGKTQGRDLLVIEWTTGTGTDRAAFDIPELDAWRSALG